MPVLCRSLARSLARWAGARSQLASSTQVPPAARRRRPPGPARLLSGACDDGRPPRGTAARAWSPEDAAVSLYSRQTQRDTFR